MGATIGHEQVTVHHGEPNFVEVHIVKEVMS